ncbi:MAG: PhzF family phenazine biosynthesis protein [Thermoplasmatota archaeon]
MAHSYRIVDVFARQPLAGNPLTVVLDAGDLTTDEMQAIARETNHSETTFITATEPTDGAWPVRIFTPKHELPFAGHPTLGTAASLMRDLGAASPVTLDLKVGRITVHQEGDLLWMRQRAPEFGPTTDAATMAACLGLTPDDLDPASPPQAVSTGIPFWIVPVHSRAALNRASLDLAKLQGAGLAEHADAVLAFCKEPIEPGSHLHARCFTIAHGIPEDPATGSANGCLAAYLASTEYLGSSSVDCVVEQGFLLERRSFLHLRATSGSGGCEVDVGGECVVVAEGTFIQT